MTTFSAKIFELFKNLKTDAVPRGPRPRAQYAVPEEVPAEENNEHNDYPDEMGGPEVVIEEPDDDLNNKKNKKPKNKNFFTKKNNTKEGKPKKQEKRNSDCAVNTQATGNVINIVNSKDVRWGDDYYMGSAKQRSKQAEDPEEEAVEKCNLITLLMEAKIKPEHEYLDYISNNLGKNWHSFFISLGYLKGRIETMELNTREYGVTEARYQLLLDWVRNQQDATLGKLTAKLWDHGDRMLVKQLAILYEKNQSSK